MRWLTRCRQRSRLCLYLFASPRKNSDPKFVGQDGRLTNIHPTHPSNNVRRAGVGLTRSMPWPLVAPIFPAGQEPLPPGMTEDDRAQLEQARKYQNMMSMGMESCVAKTAMAGGGGQ